MLKYLLLWFPMLLIAIFNGLIREIFIKKYTTDIAAHQISTILLLIFFGHYIHFAIQRIPLTTSSDALLLGSFWLILTLAFEFGFGRVRGNSWEVLLAEYNLMKGRLWILIPLWVSLAPYVFYRLKKI